MNKWTIEDGHIVFDTGRHTPEGKPIRTARPASPQELEQAEAIRLLLAQIKQLESEIATLRGDLLSTENVAARP